MDNKNNSTTDLERNLWKLFHQTHYIIAKARDFELSEFELSITRDAILSILKTSKEPPTLTEISNRILRGPSSVTEIVNRMENHGLIKKCKGSNKSMVFVEITEKGDRAYSKSKEMEVIHTIFSALTIKQQQEIYKKLLKFKKVAIGEAYRKYGTDPVRTGKLNGEKKKLKKSRDFKDREEL